MIGARHDVDRMRERLHRPERHEFEIDRDPIGQGELRHLGKLVRDQRQKSALSPPTVRREAPIAAPVSSIGL